MVIDFHTHSFPDTLAQRAMDSLKKVGSASDPVCAHTDGTAGAAMRLLKSVGIDRAIVCNIATNARQEANVNSYAISLLNQGDFFTPLGSLHPDSENTIEELDRLTTAGIKGVKLHPDYVRIPLSDDRFDRIFSILEERNVFAVIHAGYDPVSPDKVHASPEMIRAVIDKHPNLRLVAAHMGGFKRAEEVLDNLVGTHVYFDTSLTSLRVNETALLHKILAQHDPERILFGTDTPWSDPIRELEFIEKAPISQKQREMILYKNAVKLLDL